MYAFAELKNNVYNNTLLKMFTRILSQGYISTVTHHISMSITVHTLEYHVHVVQTFCITYSAAKNIITDFCHSKVELQ